MIYPFTLHSYDTDIVTLLARKGDCREVRAERERENDKKCRRCEIVFVISCLFDFSFSFFFHCFCAFPFFSLSSVLRLFSFFRMFSFFFFLFSYAQPNESYLHMENCSIHLFSPIQCSARISGKNQTAHTRTVSMCVFVRIHISEKSQLRKSRMQSQKNDKVCVTVCDIFQPFLRKLYIIHTYIVHRSL